MSDNSDLTAGWGLDICSVLSLLSPSNFLKNKKAFYLKYIGVSPNGKAWDFDSHTSQFESGYPCFLND